MAKLSRKPAKPVRKGVPKSAPKKPDVKGRASAGKSKPTANPAVKLKATIKPAKPGKTDKPTPKPAAKPASPAKPAAGKEKPAAKSAMKLKATIQPANPRQSPPKAPGKSVPTSARSPAPPRVAEVKKPLPPPVPAAPTMPPPPPPAPPPPLGNSAARETAALSDVRTWESLRRSTRANMEADRRARWEVYAKHIGVRSSSPAATLRILADGDSWFDYPFPGTGGGVIDHLTRLSHRPIMNLAHYADDQHSLMCLSQRRRLIEALTGHGITFDALLFSGGGIDLVSDQFSLFLRDCQPGMSVDDALDSVRADRALAVLRTGYDELISIRNRYAPGCKIFIHGYDFPKPSHMGFAGLGPWLKPALDYRGWVNPSDQLIIVQNLFSKLHALLADLEAHHSTLIYVRTQSLLNPHNEWGNEMHPTHSGFGRIAAAYNNTLAKHFPQAFRTH